jgi:hypothetical protein
LTKIDILSIKVDGRNLQLLSGPQSIKNLILSIDYTLQKIKFLLHFGIFFASWRGDGFVFSATSFAIDRR